jgi:glycosyltransferase involved in cell wall biosynthesis
MKILALLHSPLGTGSDTTIRRIAAHLASQGHTLVLMSEPQSLETLSRLARQHSVDVMIGTHALLSASAFAGSDLPYVIIFGGTDLNEYALDPDLLAIMTQAVDGAAALVAFTDEFLRRCLSLWPHTEHKVHLIPQGIHTRPARDFSLRRTLSLPGDAEILLLPSGLRPIKDPLMLVDCIHEWHGEDPRIHLVIAGMSYDAAFEGIVRRRCAAGPGVRYAGALPRARLQAAMREATAVVNTSLSECSPNAVLEAMRLRRPVVVRDIPGNTCVVRHDVTGLVFMDSDDFRVQAQRLLDDPALAARIGRRAGQVALTSHALRDERAAYGRMIDAVAAGIPAGARRSPTVSSVKEGRHAA